MNSQTGQALMQATAQRSQYQAVTKTLQNYFNRTMAGRVTIKSEATGPYKSPRTTFTLKAAGKQPLHICIGTDFKNATPAHSDKAYCGIINMNKAEKGLWPLHLNERKASTVEIMTGKNDTTHLVPRDMTITDVHAAMVAHTPPKTEIIREAINEWDQESNNDMLLLEMIELDMDSEEPVVFEEREGPLLYSVQPSVF